MHACSRYFEKRESEREIQFAREKAGVCAYIQEPRDERPNNHNDEGDNERIAEVRSVSVPIFRKEFGREMHPNAQHEVKNKLTEHPERPNLYVEIPAQVRFMVILYSQSFGEWTFENSGVGCA